MIEQTMLHIIILLFTSWIITTIIALALIIVLAIIIRKQIKITSLLAIRDVILNQTLMATTFLWLPISIFIIPYFIIL